MGGEEVKKIFDVLATVSVSAQLLILLLLWSPALADDREGLIGNWKLLSFYTEDAQTKERNNVYGEYPKGYAAITPEGRLFAVLTADGRKIPQSTEEQAAAFKSMIAYTGKYRVEGNKFITTVDAARNEGWTGSEQVRFWRVEGNKLIITTALMVNPNGGMMTGTLVWERE
jgi:hypothetical protein